MNLKLLDEEHGRKTYAVIFEAGEEPASGLLEVATQLEIPRRSR